MTYNARPGHAMGFLDRHDRPAAVSLVRPSFPNKAFYYLEGLTEGTETVLALVVFCLFPGHFPTLATLFASACFVTTATRLWGGYWTLRSLAG
ncbi:MAG: hypothetical protein ACTH5D_03480 [Halomonas sp.]|uniref:hypothetical protein n=1 Tax=Halomonas sp. TaxID=1486246 RepID=UPI003F917AD6